MRDFSLLNLKNEAFGVYDNLASVTTGVFDPTIRLGVTGLARSGKTVFITSLIQNLLTASRMPVLKAQNEGRISRVSLQPQPDDDIPRFSYEEHVESLMKDRRWPQSTTSISQLRLKIEYETAEGWGKYFSPGHLNVDIVDYPGEWLLDLPLISQNFETFSQNALDLATKGARRQLSATWLNSLMQIDSTSPMSEPEIKRIATEFSDYLKACKDEKWAFSTLPPGRFLLPGDLEGSPAVTFFPLAKTAEGKSDPNSLYATMERRYESYKSKVIKPFYQNHFARLDRQIILIDALQALNAGSDAVVDLERGIADILLSFNIGKNNFFENLFTRRIDKIMIAATKADHLHHQSHDKLQKLINRLVERAMTKVGASGAEIDVIAMAAVRATKEASYKDGTDELPVIIGTPDNGQQINGLSFDGKSEKAIFPGDLPEDPDSIFKALESKSDKDLRQTHDLNFVKFRPPELTSEKNTINVSLPHIRLDKAIEFLIGDRLQ
ncbi:YcjX family protein [Lentilitoribacter sp. Alg239-R112]|uniref:YcjX family protein n=1 Tax=Lentilitoribacter sp. Alg239-R112 TaxID=2305987 RepID=UPI001FCF12D1|nr:YcjX family protein [Lentilitoribacter sp. Alg239-R112]